MIILLFKISISYQSNSRFHSENQLIHCRYPCHDSSHMNPSCLMWQPPFCGISYLQLLHKTSIIINLQLLQMHRLQKVFSQFHKYTYSNVLLEINSKYHLNICYGFYRHFKLSINILHVIDIAPLTGSWQLCSMYIFLIATCEYL